MRKKIFLLSILSLILHSPILYAQNYRSVVPGQKQFFEHDSTFDFVLNTPFSFPTENNSPIKAVNFDSSSNIVNGIARYNFFTWRYPSQTGGLNCIIENGNAWTGSRMNELNNGNDLFFNDNNDTIRIKTLASVNSSWHFFNDTSGSYIQASLDSIVWMQMANIQDSVKCISLHMFSSAGILDTVSMINGKIIYLSKSNGLFSSVIFREFPQNMLILYRRAEVVMPTIGDIYNFDINDEFEYFENCGSQYEYKRIIGKSYSSNHDTLTYTFQHRTSSTTVIDTLNISFENLSMPFFNVLPEENNYSLPDSLVLNNYEIRIDSNFNYSPIYINIDGYLFLKMQTDTCYTYNNFEPAPITTEYVAGLGVVENSVNNTLMMGYFCEQKLIWYHKGNTYWGNATGLTIGLNNLDVINAKIKLFPNPASNDVKVLYDFGYSNKRWLELLDVQGKIIYQQCLLSNVKEVLLNIGAYDNGLYQIRISDDMGIRRNAKLIVQH